MERLAAEKIRTAFFRKRIIILEGPRHGGKTSMVRRLYGDPESFAWISGDCLADREWFSATSVRQLEIFIGDKPVFIVDEARRFENLWEKIKLFLDNFPAKLVILISSTRLDASNSLQEELFRSADSFIITAPSFPELAAENGIIHEHAELESRLIYGSYPEILLNPGKEAELLDQIIDDFLCKDLFANDQIKKNSTLTRLLSILALNLGKIISYKELSKDTGIDKETVERYLDALEDAFVVFRINSFSRNAKLELRKSRKVYFYDNGIRNALIRAFKPIQARADATLLWENYLISERIKYLRSFALDTEPFFWKNSRQYEVAYLEETHQKINAFTFDWPGNGNMERPDMFLKYYPEAEHKSITLDNYSEFLHIESYSFLNEIEFNNIRFNTTINHKDHIDLEED
jgi:predicted AAA+ superfamily ATPase